MARFSQTINERDAQLRSLLSNAQQSHHRVGGTHRSDRRLIHDTNAVLAALRSQSAALDQISGNISALAQQIHGFIAENRATLKPALDKLNGVLATIDNRRTKFRSPSRVLNSLRHDVRRVGLLGPVLQGLSWPICSQASSYSRLSTRRSPTSAWIPTFCCRRSAPIRRPASRVHLRCRCPYPRTGQGGEPNLTLPDAITGNPGDQRAVRRACRYPARAATRTVSHCRRRPRRSTARSAGDADRPSRPVAPTPGRCSSPRPVSPSRHRSRDGRRPDDDALAHCEIGAGCVVVAAVLRRAYLLVTSSRQIRPRPRCRLLREQQWRVRRRRCAHPRRQGRQDRERSNLNPRE